AEHQDPRRAAARRRKGAPPSPLPATARAAPAPTRKANPRALPPAFDRLDLPVAACPSDPPPALAAAPFAPSRRPSANRLRLLPLRESPDDAVSARSGRVVRGSRTEHAASRRSCPMRVRSL